MRQLETAQVAAIVRLSRSPGFRELLGLLDDLAQGKKDEAFSNNDDSRAVRLLHEGRGAMQLVDKFKSTLQQLQEDMNVRTEL